MGQLTKAASVVLAGLLLLGCSGNDDDGADDQGAPVSVTTATTTAPETGGIEVPDTPGTFAVPLPSLGVGFAVPVGWQATVLSEDALEQLAEADLARPSFLDAAHAVAATGAVFYAAGVEEDGSVSELKVDVQDEADTSPAAVAALASSVAERESVRDATIVEDLDGGRVRVDYRFSAPSADGDGEVIDAYGSQLFVPDGDRLWSFIVTSESEAVQDALLTIVGPSIVFDD